MNPNISTIQCHTSTAISSVIGNLTAVAKNYFMGRFPHEYFKSVVISTALASSQLTEADVDVPVQKLPQLVINPIYIFDDSDLSMNPLPVWRRGHQMIPRNLRGSAYPVLFNDVDGVAIWAIPNRLKVQFEVKVKVQSIMKRMELIHYLKQYFGQNEYFYLNGVVLETEVPMTLIKVVADIKGLDLKDNDKLLEYYDYLKNFSNGYINKVKNLSSGNDSFGYRFANNVLFHTEAGSEGDDNKINMVAGDSVVNFTFSFETWVASNYVFETSQPIDPSLYSVPENPEMPYKVNFSSKFKPPKIRGTKVELLWQSYITDANEGMDTINIKDMFTTGTLKIMERIKSDGLLVSDIYEVVVFKDGTELTKVTDYKFNWDTFVFETYNPLLNYTYTIGIYGNLKTINEVSFKIMTLE